VPLHPGSEPLDSALPEDYKEHHPTEHPEQWGWHGEWGGGARIGGWVVAAILLVMITATHYNDQGTLFLSISAGLIIVSLLYDRYRRKRSWRGQ
jgi:uncharacterized protein DUF2631